ncbi:WD40 repeat-containing protein [Heterostelium album PN500]|uniref:WD40 repeat-containing protein n=1 Tax=Heterostelium pallidum (strain ATCC 26659 / Pp 5 / PN500) TaxID=670386 RepID=D3BVR5_HETP5|nr:WD40 repeat-containing protein [Heterostelium album PN500]EFA74568.1 WD40 repeat-containing protein [Heterostelium album PN500]|eukprot:XP_020426702.1 WD40 repeat-containing protein [Heterostelium album PN500]
MEGNKKRQADNRGLIVVDNNSNNNSKKVKNELALRQTDSTSKEIILGTERTSKLKSPIMQLSGHKGEVFTVKFNSTGTAIASGSFDKEIFLWGVYEDCINYQVLKGHKGSVTELHWDRDGEQLYSVCTDKSVGIWDVKEGRLIKRIREHHAFVNSCCPVRRGPPLVATASDDCSARVFDTRKRHSVQTFQHKYPVTAVCFSDASDQVITGGIDNVVRVYDIRNNESELMILQGHSDTVTGLSVSPDGSHLLSNSMDNTLKVWDIRPFAPNNRCVKSLIGAQHGIDKNLLKCAWSPDGSKVTAGSSDSLVYVWDVSSGKILYRLPGHTGVVNQVEFHPNEPIIASCSADKTIFLGEIKP